MGQGVSMKAAAAGLVLVALLFTVGWSAPVDFDQEWNEQQVPETQAFDVASMLMKPIMCKMTNAFKLSQKTAKGKKVLADIEGNPAWKKFALGNILKCIKDKNKAKEEKQVAALMQNVNVMELIPLMNLFLTKMAKFNGGMPALTKKLQQGC